MKNRKLLLIVSLVLAMTMSLGGTLAYLTDSDGDVNVMTVGRVEIKQNEQDRDGNGFEQKQQLLPIVTPVGTKDEVYNMYPADPNYIDKIVTVTNSGNTAAWVRTLIAIPEFTYEGKPENNASGEVLHWNGYSEGDTAANGYPAAERLPGTNTDVTNHWWWGKEGAESSWPNNGGEWNSIPGVKLFEDSDLTYTVMFVTHTTKLGAKETTAPNLLGIYLDSKVDYDNDNGYYTMNKKQINGLTGDVKIPVLSQAVQASGFDTAWEAFDEAFKLGDDPATTIAGWFGEMKQDTQGENNVPPVFADVTVDNLADLKDALDEAAENGEPVSIDAKGNNLGDLDGVKFPEGTVIYNATFTGDENHGSYGNGALGTVKFVNCTFDSDYAYAAHFDNGGGDLVFENCTFKGWNAFGTAINTLTFNNCTFGKNDYYGIVRTYQNATFTGCTFEADFEGVDVNEIAPEGTTITLTGCNGIDVNKLFFNTGSAGTAKDKCIFILNGVNVSEQVKEW